MAVGWGNRHGISPSPRLRGEGAGRRMRGMPKAKKPSFAHPSFDPSGHLLPEGRKGRAATSYSHIGIAHTGRQNDHAAPNARRGSLIHVATGRAQRSFAPQPRRRWPAGRMRGRHEMQRPDLPPLTSRSRSRQFPRPASAAAHRRQRPAGPRRGGRARRSAPRTARNRHGRPPPRALPRPCGCAG